MPVTKTAKASPPSFSDEDYEGEIGIVDNRGHDFLWMQNDVVRHKLRVIGIEAFTVYAMCCYFMDCPDRFSLKRMHELSGMSEDACEEAMKTLVKARLIATRGAGAELRYFVVQYRETEAAKE